MLVCLALMLPELTLIGEGGLAVNDAAVILHGHRRAMHRFLMLQKVRRREKTLRTRAHVADETFTAVFLLHVLLELLARFAYHAAANKEAPDANAVLDCLVLHQGVRRSECVHTVRDITFMR